MNFGTKPFYSDEASTILTEGLRGSSEGANTVPAPTAGGPPEGLAPDTIYLLLRSLYCISCR